jgi:undecaprenyl-diphosphatase
MGKQYKSWLLTLVIILILIIAGASYLILTRKNIHLVSSNRLPPIYRSAQLSHDDLERLIKSKNINLILNLRGESQEEYYIEEKNLAEHLGLEYYAHGFSVYRPPDRERFLSILEVLDYAKSTNKKILIHCKAGADRTGLISAISQIYLYNFPVDKALHSSLSWRYGHWPDPNGPLEQILIRYRKVEHEMNFKDWIKQQYNRNEILEYSSKYNSRVKAANGQI